MAARISRQLNILSNLENPWIYWGHKFGLIKREPLFLKLRNGITAEVPIRMLHTFKESVFQEDYISGFPEAVIRSFKQSLVVDVGANVGYFSLWWLSRFPQSKVIAVEPMPNNFALLSRNKALNEDKDLQVLNSAMNSQGGDLTLNFDQADSFTTSASALNDNGGKDKISVKAITLSQLKASFNLDRIDFLKLDCEGSEYDILYHCEDKLLYGIQCIVMETHRGGKKNECKEAMCDFLRAKKFQVNPTRGALVYAHR